MQINRRLTNGLAWAGLFVVVAVPVADALSGQLMGDRTVNAAMVAEADAPVPAPLAQRPDAEPVLETAAIAPAQPAVKPAASSPVVDSFLSSGKKLPSYITGGDAAPVAAAPAPTAPVVTKPVVTPPAQTATVPSQPSQSNTPVAIDPVEVASLTPQKIAPVPMPLSMRPLPVMPPLASQPVDETIVLPPTAVARNTAPVVVDDLADWESGPLSDFLAARQAQGQRPAAESYDQNGFFLSDGPNQRRRRDIYVGPADSEVYYPFGR